VCLLIIVKENLFIVGLKSSTSYVWLMLFGDCVNVDSRWSHFSGVI